MALNWRGPARSGAVSRVVRGGCAVVAAGAIALGAAGCESDNGHVSETLARDDGIATHEWNDGDAAMQALLTGTLEVRNGCLVVGSGRQGDPVLPAFPRRLARWDAEADVLDYGGREYRAGDVISTGGGWAPSAELVVPAACEAWASAEVFLVEDTELVPLEQRD